MRALMILMFSAMMLTACADRSGDYVEPVEPLRTEPLFDWAPTLPGGIFPAVAPGQLAEDADILLRDNGFAPYEIEDFDRLLAAISGKPTDVSVPYYNSERTASVHVFYVPVGENMVVGSVFYGIRARFGGTDETKALADQYTLDLIAKLGEPDDTYDAGNDTYFLTWYVDERYSDDAIGASSIRMTRQKSEFDVHYSDGMVDDVAQDSRRLMPAD